MRPVSGFERPALQWAFVGIGVLLAALAAAQTVAIRRARAEVEQARTREMNARLDRQQLEIELSRERRARETLALDAARRDASAPGDHALPTLTLSPVGTRAATPPAASVAAADPRQVIELRLLLPAGRRGPAGSYAVTLRRWSTGETVWLRAGLDPNSAGTPLVSTLITGDLLTEGSYELLLSSTSAAGATEIASYELTVAPKTR